MTERGYQSSLLVFTSTANLCDLSLCKGGHQCTPTWVGSLVIQNAASALPRPPFDLTLQDGQGNELEFTVESSG